ncbi:hypothetical protein BDV39DRAFT_205438 [Aspergillus sergii]|uniref:Uncharacterized protein n=1 Tax=Aspergillus sergii TaxID=1034303 RepID=A0A5N6X1E5_9EURO|nr:hypothetical protein BDV39DRAFT_205438 [Aspergillus sergii]
MTISTQGPVHLTFVGGGHLAQAIISGILSSTNPWALKCSITVTADGPNMSKNCNRDTRISWSPTTIWIHSSGNTPEFHTEIPPKTIQHLPSSSSAHAPNRCPHRRKTASAHPRVIQSECPSYHCDNVPRKSRC